MIEPVDGFVDNADLDALIERVLAEGEAAGVVPSCVVCGARLYPRADAPTLWPGV